MKKLWAVFAILLAFTLTTEVAHAKRFGGGKSFGQSHQTTPSQPSRSADMPASNKPMMGQAAKPAGKGMLGGLLGGLLVGGLFAALFAGGAFHGLQFTDILIAAALAFVLFKVFKMMRQGSAAPVTSPPMPEPAYFRSDTSTPASVTPIFGQRRDGVVGTTSVEGSSHAVPMSLPLGFDTSAFLDGAKEHYRILQDAWNKNDLAKIEEYVTPELYADLTGERASMAATQHTEVINVHSELVRADESFGVAEVSIRFSGRYRDAVEGVEEDFTDIWHLSRNSAKESNPWLITGIQSA